MNCRILLPHSERQLRSLQCGPVSFVLPPTTLVELPMKLTCYQIDTQPAEMVPGQPERDWMSQFNDRHPYRCLPLVVANTSGWELLSPVSFTATWNGGPLGKDMTLVPTGATSPELLQRWATSHFGGGVLTFHTGFLFRTEEGWDMWTGGSPNRIKDGIQPLTAIVETYWLPFPFTMNWHFTRPGTVAFEKSEPYCFVMPVPHQTIDVIEPIVKPLQSDPELFKEYSAWGASRSQFIKDLAEGKPETVKQGWQRDYFTGRTPQGHVMTDTHVNRRRLKPPRPAKEGE